MDSERLNKFGTAIKLARITLGKSQLQLSVEAKISYSQMSNIENGRNWPSLPVYAKLCSLLGVYKPPFFP